MPPLGSSQLILLILVPTATYMLVAWHAYRRLLEHIQREMPELHAEMHVSSEGKTVLDRRKLVTFLQTSELPPDASGPLVAAFEAAKRALRGRSLLNGYCLLVVGLYVVQGLS